MRWTLGDHAWSPTAVLVALLTTAACGGGPPPPADEPDGIKVTHHDQAPGGSVSGGGDQMHVEGTVGGLNRRAVQRTFNEAMPTMRGCIDDGRKQLPFLGGDIAVAIEIDPSGKALSVLLTKSTLGDHRVEACIVKALEAKQWPRPVGGKVGQTSSSFGWQSDHLDPPQQWSTERLASAMAAEVDPEEENPGPPPFSELEAKLGECRNEAGASPMDVTVYLDEDGMPQSFGVSVDDAQGLKAIDCLSTVLQTTSFPAPGGSFAKVTVPVR
ncbi:MAG: AgmX/PglI C-terminal domain-containing protein [Deltaproteobacteria bacterium]|nr:AgmX/PglI C-terminal domain-containing protein [Deltaproteobacteria bacterium]